MHPNLRIATKLISKSILIALCVTLLAAGCNPFSTPTQGGLVKTLNGGEDWQFINKVKDSAKDTLVGLSISTIVADPSRKDKIFAGSYNAGLYVSEDGGNSWSQILSKIAVYDFVVDPNDSNLIYVAGVYADHGKVLATHDGGKSWEEVFNEASTQNPVRAVALNPADPKQVIIGLSSGSVIKSIDGGTSWRLVGSYQDRINKIRWQPGEVFVLFRTKGLFKSTDSGDSFFDNNFGLKSSESFYQSSVSGLNNNNFNQFVVSPYNSATIYVSSANGLYKTVDSGATWQKLPVPVVDANVPLRAIALSASNENVAYASAGATIYKTLDGGVQWKTQSVNTAGFINALLVDPSLPQVAYGGIFLQQ